MNRRTTVTSIALVVLAAATAAYAYFVDSGRVSDADREGRRTDVFPSFRVAEVTHVELAPPARRSSSSGTSTPAARRRGR